MNTFLHLRQHLVKFFSLFQIQLISLYIPEPTDSYGSKLNYISGCIVPCKEWRFKGTYRVGTPCITRHGVHTLFVILLHLKPIVFSVRYKLILLSVKHQALSIVSDRHRHLKNIDCLPPRQDIWKVIFCKTVARTGRKLSLSKTWQHTGETEV